MSSLLIAFLLFAIANADPVNCPSNRVNLCSDVPEANGCSNYYQFNFDQTTRGPYWNPVWCMDDPNSNYCKDTPETPTGSGTGICNPPCSIGKLYQSSGLCSSISTQSTCALYYSSSYQWCYWDTNFCYTASAFDCHT